MRTKGHNRAQGGKRGYNKTTWGHREARGDKMGHKGAQGMQGGTYEGARGVYKGDTRGQ